MTDRELPPRALHPSWYEVLALPIDMVLYCPLCGLQHIDAPYTEHSAEGIKDWNNPPHRSHKCGRCNHIWRPADVPTNGVAAIKTRGKNDSPAVNARVRQHTSETIAQQMAMRKLVEESGRNIEPDLIGAQMQALAHESAASATPRPAVDVKVTVKTDQGEMTLAEWQRDNKGRLVEVTKVGDDGRVMVPDEREAFMARQGYRCMCFECALSRGEA